MSYPNYPVETLHEEADDGTMVKSLSDLTESVVGRKIVSVYQEERRVGRWDTTMATVLVLDDGRKVSLVESGDCCAYTNVEEFLLHPESVDHMILGVGTTEKYTSWHIYADFGDIMRLKVGWSCGNPFYYGYGFTIEVDEV